MSQNVQRCFIIQSLKEKPVALLPMSGSRESSASRQVCISGTRCPLGSTARSPKCAVLRTQLFQLGRRGSGLNDTAAELPNAARSVFARPTGRPSQSEGQHDGEGQGPAPHRPDTPCVGNAQALPGGPTWGWENITCGVGGASCR